MYKTISLALGIGLFAIAGVASAASITNIEFSNGDVTYQGKGGTSVNAEFRVVVPAGEVVEQFETDVISDGLAPRCESVGGTRGLEEGTHFVTRSIKLPPNTGEFDVNVRTAGIFGGTRSIDCDDSTNGSASFSDAIRVASTGTTSNDDNLGSESGLIAWLTKWLEENFPKATKPAYCDQMAQYAALYVGANGSQVVALQALLMGNGFSIPALSQGVAYGFYGSQTLAAHSAAKVQCN